MNVCTPLAAVAAGASQRGAEDPYATQLFGTSGCSKRTLLGACSEEAGPSTRASPGMEQAPKLLVPAPAEPDSELILKLKQRTADNAEKNARLVKEKTLSAP